MYRPKNAAPNTAYVAVSENGALCRMALCPTVLDGSPRNRSDRARGRERRACELVWRPLTRESTRWLYSCRSPSSWTAHRKKPVVVIDRTTGDPWLARAGFRVRPSSNSLGLDGDIGTALRFLQDDPNIRLRRDGSYSLRSSKDL